MPSFKDLRCSIEIGKYDTKLTEFHTTYADREVKTFVVVPDKPTTFSVHLESEAHVAEGLIALAWIDGVYQGNKVATGLRAPDKLSAGIPANIRIRQKCIPNGKGGHFIGSQWIFHPLAIGTAESGMNLREQVKADLGRMDIVVLRCKPTNPGRSQSDGTAPAKAPAKTKNKDEQQAVQTASAKPVGKAASKRGSDKASSIGGLFGLFDGVTDDLDHKFQFPPRTELDGHHSYQHKKGNNWNRLPSPQPVIADDSDDEVAKAKEALLRAEFKQLQRRQGREKKYSITHNDLMSALDEASRRSWHQYASMQQMMPQPMPGHQQWAYGYPHPGMPMQEGPLPLNQLARSPPPEDVANRGHRVAFNLQQETANNPTAPNQPGGQYHNNQAQQSAEKTNGAWDAAAKPNDNSWNINGGQEQSNWETANQSQSWADNEKSRGAGTGDANWNGMDNNDKAWTQDKTQDDGQVNGGGNTIPPSGGNDAGVDGSAWGANDQHKNATTNTDWNTSNPAGDGGGAAGWNEGGDNTQGWPDNDKDKANAGAPSNAEWDNTNAGTTQAANTDWNNTGPSNEQTQDTNWDTQVSPKQQANSGNWDNKPASNHGVSKPRRGFRSAKKHRHTTHGGDMNTTQTAPAWIPGFETTHYEHLVPKRTRKPLAHPALTVPDDTPAVKYYHADTYVAAADTVDYVHKVKRLEYIDSKERPYAIFRFYYRTEKAMQKLLPGLDLTQKQDDGEVRRMVGRMSRLELERELLKMKGIKEPGSSGGSGSEASDSDDFTGSSDTKIEPSGPATQGANECGGNNSGWTSNETKWENTNGSHATGANTGGNNAGW